MISFSIILKNANSYKFSRKDLYFHDYIECRIVKKRRDGKYWLQWKRNINASWEYLHEDDWYHMIYVAEDYWPSQYEMKEAVQPRNRLEDCIKLMEKWEKGFRVWVRYARGERARLRNIYGYVM